MKIKYLHLIRKTRVVASLKRLIGDHEGHSIIVLSDRYTDTEGNDITRSVLLDKISNCETLFIHFMDIEKTRLLNQVTKPPKVVWFMWGGDGYHLGKFYNDFLLPKTKALKWKLGFKQFRKGGWKDLGKMLLGSMSDYIYPNNEVLKAIRKADFIVPVIPQDYELLTSRYDLNAQLFHLNYVNDAFVTHPEVHESQSKNILLGNSAHYSNNHIEVIDKLAAENLEDRQVIIPISYGDKVYGRYIKNYAHDLLGDNVRVLDSYLPLDEYRALIDSCDTVIMNQCRQQAVGNLIIALWFEKTIYLNKSSGLFDYMMDNNFHILDIDLYYAGNVLDEQQRKHNKKQLFKTFGPERSQKRFGELLRILDDMDTE